MGLAALPFVSLKTILCDVLVPLVVCPTCSSEGKQNAQLCGTSVLPSVCPIVHPPVLTSSLQVINSSSLCCSSVKDGFGVDSLWSSSRQSKQAVTLLEISRGRRASSCLSPNLKAVSGCSCFSCSGKRGRPFAAELELVWRMAGLGVLPVSPSLVGFFLF